MKHVTEYCGNPENLIVCTPEEYSILQAALEKIGVEVRTVTYSCDRVEMQMRNPWKDWCIIGNSRSGEEIANYVKRDVESKSWRR